MDLERPVVHPPSGPAPNYLVVQDLRIGSGRPAHWDDRVGIWYIGADYRSGAEWYHRWRKAPLTFRLGSESISRGLERGIDGMKLGGRREIILPVKFAYGSGPLDYVVQLMKLEPEPETATKH